MKLLILEDSETRIEAFKELFKNQQVDFTSTVEDAKKACLSKVYNCLFLDHDLEGRIWEDSSKENTGFQFVKWLVDNKMQMSALCYIHSANPIGANRMLNYLRDNGRDGIWCPYHTWKI